MDNRSKESWEAATKNAVAEASKTVENIQTVYVSELQAVLEKDGSFMFRVNAKISFIVQ
jgi:dodecin